MAGHRFNPEKAKKLESPERKKLLPPEHILQDFGIEKSDVVLDLGAGTGYFSIPASKMTEEQVYALDVEPRMLQHVEERMQEEKVSNVQLVEGAIEKIPVADQKVNKVIASMVLHETDDLPFTLQEIHRVLKPEGKALFIEWEKKEMDQGPPVGHRLSIEELQEKAQEAGLKTEKAVQENGKVYLLHVVK